MCLSPISRDRHVPQQQLPKEVAPEVGVRVFEVQREEAGQQKQVPEWLPAPKPPQPLVTATILHAHGLHCGGGDSQQLHDRHGR